MNLPARPRRKYTAGRAAMSTALFYCQANMIYHPFKNAKIISLQDQLGRIRPNFLADIMGVA